MSNLDNIITEIGSTVAALTPSPATPTFSQSDYRRDLEDHSKGDIERKFEVGFVRKERDQGLEGNPVRGGTTVNNADMYLDLGYHKKRYIGGGGTKLAGRADTDTEQIISTLENKSNWGSNTRIIRNFITTEQADNEQMRIYRISFDLEYWESA